ncbi:tRNA (adenosine(37)-N6)-threonylcarbamoyltransferase complex dimerization subunit type 1 TsaB [Emcibacter sp.]|uniref:tRNA (adenosine(37)-N6)-threonylcarbamoyltransferase complex dimerization subunit type 1 TsaB n=1 Tax=Emcibacter sp. TaxID=1979954 RepID=UPI003A93F383
MNILAIDTALGACSAALLVDGDVVAGRFEERQRGHAERLLPMVEEVLEEAGLARSGLQGVACTRGPGTFTGVRIGLSAAKGLCLALDIPLAGFTSLEVVAHNVIHHPEVKEGTLCVAHDARRGEVYFQKFVLSDGQVKAAGEPKAVALEKIHEELPSSPCSLIGTGAALVMEAVPEESRPPILLPEVGGQPDARIMAVMAGREPDRFQKERVIAPLYLRAPDAVRPKVVPLPFQEGK